MSLFEYAQEVVSRKLEREKPVLSVSMGMQPVMPMAQGGGLSSVQNSLNINGQPHRLAYINPNEEDLLKSLGGSGEKVNGIPAYLMGGEEGQGADGESNGTADGMGVGGYSDAQSDATTQGLDAAMAEADAEGAAIGEAVAYSSPQNQAPATDLGFYGPYSVPEQTFNDRSEFSKGKGLSFDIGLLGVLGGLFGGPVGAAIGKGADNALGTSMSVNTGIGAQSMGYGDTGTGNQGGSGQSGDDDGSESGDDSGDLIIKEKIAAVKEVPVEDVSDADVASVKQTAKERIAGTNIEDIIRQMYGVAQANRLLNINRQPTEEEEEINQQADLIDSIYGPGSSARLLGITTNNTGTA